ncbi:o-spanin [Xanthomonas virus PB119]|nr:o-spanin [Xanthomonas virus PB119]
MNLLKRIGNMLLKLLPCSLILIAGCSSAPNARSYTNVSPKAEPLSAEILQAMQADSTPLLKKGEHWNKSTGQLLDSVTDKSKP